MAPQSANVTSTEVLRMFRSALLLFAERANNGLVSLELESRRAVDWIENDRARYWPRELKKALDVVSEARNSLQRAESSAGEGQNRSCIDEKKALEKAKRRVDLCEEKIRAVRRWRQVVKKEVEEFTVQSAKLKDYLDNDLLRAVAALQRMSEALAHYVQQMEIGPSAGVAERASTSQNLPSEGNQGVVE